MTCSSTRPVIQIQKAEVHIYQHQTTRKLTRHAVRTCTWIKYFSSSIHFSITAANNTRLLSRIGPDRSYDQADWIYV